MDDTISAKLSPVALVETDDFVDSRLDRHGYLRIHVECFTHDGHAHSHEYVSLSDCIALCQRLKGYRGQRVQGIVLEREDRYMNPAYWKEYLLLLENVAYFLRHHHFSNVDQPFLSIFNSNVETIDKLVDALCDNINVHVSDTRISTFPMPSPRVIHRLSAKLSPVAAPETDDVVDSRLDDKGYLQIDFWFLVQCRCDNRWFESRYNCVTLCRCLKDYRGQRVRGIVMESRHHEIHADPLKDFSFLLENVAYFLRHHPFSNVSRPFLCIRQGEQVETVDKLIEALCDNMHVSDVRILTYRMPSPRVFQRWIQKMASSIRSNKNHSFLELHQDERFQPRGRPDYRPPLHLYAKVGTRKYDVFSCAQSFNRELSGVVMTSSVDKLTFNIPYNNDPSNYFEKSFLLNATMSLPGLCFILWRGLEGAATYSSFVSHRAVKRIELEKCKFGSDDVLPGRAFPVTTPPVVHLDHPLEKVTLTRCKLGRNAVRVLSSRPIKALQLQGCRVSTTPAANLVDDFLVDLCQSQPSLCELNLGGTKLSAVERRSLCLLLERPDCHIQKLRIGSDESKWKTVVAPRARNEFISIFFDQLANNNMPSLWYLEFHCFVTSEQIGSTIVTGVRSNMVLRKLHGLEVQQQGTGTQRLQQEIDFCQRCLNRGSYVVKNHLNNPVGTPLGLLTKVLYRCVSSGRDLDVLFYFLRQIESSLVTRPSDLQ